MLAETGGSAGERMVTVDAYWQRWRAGPLLSPDRKAATIELYTGVMRTHVLPAIGTMRLSRLSAGDVEAMLAGMVRQRDSKHGKVGDPVSGQLRRTAFTVLQLMLSTAVRDGVASRNVCADLDRPKVDTPEADYLTPAQLSAVLAALSGHRLEPLIVLLAGTGIRIGEALALRWEDLDLDRGQLRITGTVRVVERHDAANIAQEPARAKEPAHHWGGGCPAARLAQGTAHRAPAGWLVLGRR